MLQVQKGVAALPPCQLGNIWSVGGHSSDCWILLILTWSSSIAISSQFAPIAIPLPSLPDCTVSPTQTGIDINCISSYIRSSLPSNCLRAIDTPHDHPLPSLFTTSIAYSLLKPRIPIDPLYTASPLPAHHHHQNLLVTQRNNTLLCPIPVPKHTKPCRCHTDHHQLHPQCLPPANQAAQLHTLTRRSHCHASPASIPPDAKHYSQSITINRPQTAHRVRSQI